MGALTYRLATLSDIPGIVELVTASYRGDDSRRGWTSEADLIEGQRITPDVLRGDLLRADSAVLLAEVGGALIGCAHIAREDDGSGYFGMFAVHSDGQGGGDGKLILAEAERRAATDWGVTTMTMTVINLREELIAFYERRGYRRTGQYKPFPYGDDRFGIPRRSDLRLEVLEKRLK